MGIIVGIVMAVIGTLMCIFNEKMLAAFGRIPSFEEHFRFEGGSRFFYLLLGLILIVIGFMLIFGLFEALALSILGPIFRL